MEVTLRPGLWVTPERRPPNCRAVSLGPLAKLFQKQEEALLVLVATVSRLFKTGTQEVVAGLNHPPVCKSSVLGLEKIRRHKTVPAREIPQSREFLIVIVHNHL